MSLTVATLNGIIFNKDIIADFVKVQLGTIDKKIRDTCKLTSVPELVYELPIVFPPAIDNNHNAKLLVYKEIITSLEQRGFTVALKKIEGRATFSLVIGWTIEYSNKDLEDFLRQYIHP